MRDRSRAIVVDIDGTVALRGGRDPYDERHAGEDLPNNGVVACIRAMAEVGYRVIFVTGRREQHRLQTAIWLRTHAVPSFALHMRGQYDERSDAELKNAMRLTIEVEHEIVAVFDDRDSVVAMWRQSGLTCLQVAPGDF